MNKMIITDLDNTLLQNDKNISEYNMNILRKCQEKGIKIVFATARSTQASSRILDQFKPDIFVGYGGALIMAGGKVIHRIDISAEISNKIIKESLKIPEVQYILAINESIALTNNIESLEIKDSSHYKYVDFSSDYNHRYLKISLFSSSQVVVEKIASNYPMCDMLRYTGEDLYRFANRDAVKWNAIKAIADYYNLSTNMFIAFGDDRNDLEMIENCGIGIAVENAIDDVKSVAKYVCDSNENNGVGKWLEENIL
jgi:Cof subfamily protein (haloacid dehalogenase superfamily)